MIDIPQLDNQDLNKVNDAFGKVDKEKILIELKKICFFLVKKYSHLLKHDPCQLAWTLYLKNNNHEKI